MKRYTIPSFGVENLKLIDDHTPTPGPGEVLLDVHAFSLNYRDLMVIKGMYNPKLPLPATPISDGAGVVTAVGADVTRVKVGDRVMSHFVAPWLDGPFDARYVGETLGTPGPGLAAEKAVVPADALVPVPADYDFAQAATLPIAALTAWSALDTIADLQPSQTMLTLGTGGVAIFALQLAKARGARVIITSSSDEKLERTRQLGADHTINYVQAPAWEDAVLEYTDGVGVDLTVETAGPGTLDQSMRATRAAGTIGLLGALTGRAGQVTTGLILMKRLHIAGILVDSRAAFEKLVRFIEQHKIDPVISDRFSFDEFPAALRHMEAGGHFGKIVVTR